MFTWLPDVENLAVGALLPLPEPGTRAIIWPYPLPCSCGGSKRGEGSLHCRLPPIMDTTWLEVQNQVRGPFPPSLPPQLACWLRRGIAV